LTWLLNLVCHIKGRTQVEGVSVTGAEKDIGTWDAGIQSLEKTAHD